jgi:hypothetical protein
MIGRYSAEEEPTHWVGEFAARVKAVRDKWTVSGMYRNDGSVTPLWTVDWYAYTVDVPAGGELVVRYRSGGLGTGPGPALGFYRQNELIRGYDISDLLTFSWLADHGHWLSEHRLSDDSKTVTVITQMGDEYVFDVQSGDKILSYRPVRYAAVGVVAFLVVVGWWLIRRRWINRLRAAPTNR